ncbi:MAG TPA: late competence development ComFB family protein [Rectinemataceae bacterium]|nr:late competence development ComFB family protein [Rectinemataceae bacterium]
MAFRDSYDFGVLVNEAERMVVDELERRLAELDDPGICVCQDCVLDMAAFALNTLKPVYRVSLLGTMYAHAMDDGSYAEDVRKAVDAGISKVHANPSHD